MDIETKTVTLETPIKRAGDVTLEKVSVRKPAAGELRGTSLVNLLNMDVGSLEIVLPRITTPPLLKAEVAAMDPADLVQLATEVSGFLLTRQAKESFPTA
ncbi:phage tail assembly protein [Luteibacter sp. NPDC031894]|uniref:phage tail assembly protein n=1 Tax=Luteibacter sp. NPDC031894 TaxID=3390572 RepID=UPI003D07B414